MTLSKQEEIIGTLWIIAAILAFSDGHQVLGWVCGIKGVADQVCSIMEAYKARLEKK